MGTEALQPTADEHLVNWWTHTHTHEYTLIQTHTYKHPNSNTQKHTHTSTQTHTHTERPGTGSLPIAHTWDRQPAWHGQQRRCKHALRQKPGTRAWQGRALLHSPLRAPLLQALQVPLLKQLLLEHQLLLLELQLLLLQLKQLLLRSSWIQDLPGGSCQRLQGRVLSLLGLLFLPLLLPLLPPLRQARRWIWSTCTHQSH